MAFPESGVARAGKYTQIRLIGRGSGGNVYYALDNLGREVAVKEALPAHASVIDPLDRFRKEVRLHALLRHPNILQVYHLEEDNPQTRECYLICEYANGDFGVAKDLDRRRAGQPTTQRGSSHPGTPEYMASFAGHLGPTKQKLLGCGL